LGSKQGKFRDRTSPVSQGSAASHEPPAAFPVTRYLKLLGVAVGSAPLIIVVVVLLTPPEDSDENPARLPSNANIDGIIRSAGRHSGLVLPSQAEQVDVEKIERELVDLAEHLHHSESAMRTLADALASLGELDQATRVLGECVQDFPDEAENWLRLGQMQILVRRFEEAEASFRRSIALGDHGEHVLVALHTTLTRQGKLEEAIRVRELLRDLNSLPTTRAEPAGAPFHTRFAQAFRQDAYLWFVGAALVDLDHGDREHAEMLLKREISLESRQSNSYVLLAAICHQDGRPQDLVVVLRTADKTGTGSRLSYVWPGYWDRARVPVPLLLGPLGRLIELEPENVQHYVGIAAAADQIGREDLSERVLQLAI
jgi:tetratricopeptide (TPR) repeat protein